MFKKNDPPQSFDRQFHVSSYLLKILKPSEVFEHRTKNYKLRAGHLINMSLSTDNLGIKQPIKRLEIQINNFNVAIPHHVDLLKQHKHNIKKYQTQRDWERVRREHINVSRLIKQLKELLYQMDTLRAQVLDSDINAFDKLTAKARGHIMNAINDYLDFDINEAMKNTSPIDENQGTDDPLRRSYIQLQAEEEDLQHREACMHAWNALHNDIEQLHQLFVDFNQIVQDQKESVNIVECNVEETEINVIEGTKSLEKAAKYKAAAYPIAGALLGTCIGGPIGLVAGLKIGGLAAIGCGILGFTGGTFLKKKEASIKSVSRTTDVTETEIPDSQNAVSTTELSQNNKKNL